MTDFCALILTHGRPDNVITYETLRKFGYTGPIYLVVDDMDKTLPQYRERYGDEVVVFSKQEVAKRIDVCDNFKEFRAILYARNAAFDIAKQLGYTYFIELDDDYTGFDFRINGDMEYPRDKFRIRNIDPVMKALLDFYKKTPILTSIAWAQGGDFIGGKDSGFGQWKPSRKAMNSFICSTERPFQFRGTLNEDVNTYTNGASQGLVFLTVPYVSLTQKITQSNDGGLTHIYQDRGTYFKSFYTIIVHPSGAKIGMMGDKHQRIHHQVLWNNTAPKILAPNWKK